MSKSGWPKGSGGQIRINKCSRPLKAAADFDDIIRHGRNPASPQQHQLPRRNPIPRLQLHQVNPARHRTALSSFACPRGPPGSSATWHCFAPLIFSITIERMSRCSRNQLIVPRILEWRGYKFFSTRTKASPLNRATFMSGRAQTWRNSGSCMKFLGLVVGNECQN